MQSRNDGRALSCQLPMGEAQDAEAQALELRIAAAVRFKGRAVRVMPEPVGLDDQVAVAPDEVDLVRAQPGIHLWPGKAVAAAEVEKNALQLAAGEVRVALKVRIRDQPQVQRSADRTAENRLGNGTVEVAEGSRRLGHPDAVAAGRNTGNEGGGAVDGDAMPLPASAVAGDGDVDWT
jgi:hypothetical protein